MNYRVKKEWTTKAGLKAVIVLVSPSMPHYCGYVGVEKENPTYGKPYYYNIDDEDEDTKIYKEDFKQIMEQINDIGIHGGLTYAKANQDYPIDNDTTWWFGFDAAHAGDATAWEDGKELLETDEEKEVAKTTKGIIGKCETDTVNGFDYMEEQCEILAKQLKEIT